MIILAKNKKETHGYTIIEVMIFLIVSMGLFSGAFLMVNTQSRRTAFTQSVQTFDQEMRDVLNDVETGFYPGSPGQGTNAGFITIGKAVQFDGSNFEVFTIAGNRLADGEDVSSISEVDPYAVESPISRGSLSAQLEVTRVVPAGGGSNLRGFAVLSGFGQASQQSGLTTRSSLATLRNGISGGAGISLTNTDISNAANGILICLQEQGGGREATVRIGGGIQGGTSATIYAEGQDGDPLCD